MKELTLRQLLGVALTLTMVACGSKQTDDTLQVPDEFDAPFVTGQVCMPSQAKTGSDGQTQNIPKLPLKIQTCVYRCISVGATHVSSYWQCGAGSCVMVLLAWGHVTRVESEKNCDARQLPNPKDSDCQSQTYPFTLDTPGCSTDDSPHCDDHVPVGPFVVTVPYLDEPQGQELMKRIGQGEPLIQAAQEVVGTQSYPSRRFTVDFDSSYPEVSDAAALTGNDCHDITAP